MGGASGLSDLTESEGFTVTGEFRAIRCNLTMYTLLPRSNSEDPVRTVVEVVVEVFFSDKTCEGEEEDVLLENRVGVPSHSP